MTNNEAVKELKKLKQLRWQSGNYSEVFDVAIKALEKQIPKKPTEADQTDQRWVEVGFNCPSCDSVIFRYDGDYCPDCGQAIDWGEDDIPMEYFENGGI